MAISERVEDVTGESLSWWTLELYKVAFLLVGGTYIGWQVGGQSATTPPEALAWFLAPGIFYLLFVVLPIPGFGSGGLSM